MSSYTPTKSQCYATWRLIADVNEVPEYVARLSDDMVLDELFATRPELLAQYNADFANMRRCRMLLANIISEMIF